MWEVGVVVIDPFVDGDFKVKRVIPIIAPDNVFFDGTHDTFSVRVAFRVNQVVKICLMPRIEEFILKR